MTRFGPRIEPITSPTPGECANYYATDAGDYIVTNHCTARPLLEPLKCLAPVRPPIPYQNISLGLTENVNEKYKQCRKINYDHYLRVISKQKSSQKGLKDVVSLRFKIEFNSTKFYYSLGT